jgi:hypothetical protein
MKALLEGLRQQLTPAARLREKDEWLQPPPPWMTPQDVLHAYYRNPLPVLEEGEITWGVVFMGNSALWKPGPDDLPIGLVYSFDPWFERHPERLGPIATSLFGFHGSDDPPPLRPWERQIRDALHSGFERPLHQLLPPSLSGGRVVYHTSAIGSRAHLPNGCLNGTLLPVLVRRARPPRSCVPVPHRYWPREILHRW